MSRESELERVQTARALAIPEHLRCKHCYGTGACPRCGGVGVTNGGDTVCGRCGGEEWCDRCDGSGEEPPNAGDE